jgi:hypothetical protein
VSGQAAALAPVWSAAAGGAGPDELAGRLRPIIERVLATALAALYATSGSVISPVDADHMG